MSQARPGFRGNPGGSLQNQRAQSGVLCPENLTASRRAGGIRHPPWVRLRPNPKDVKPSPPWCGRPCVFTHATRFRRTLITLHIILVKCAPGLYLVCCNTCVLSASLFHLVSHMFVTCECLWSWLWYLHLFVWYWFKCHGSLMSCHLNIGLFGTRCHVWAFMCFKGNSCGCMYYWVLTG